MLPALNHDLALNLNPERFDVARKNIKHFSFGGGRHICAGAPLARLEAAEIGFFERCTPGYYNLEGKLTAEAAQGFGYGEGPAVFFKLVEQWRSDGAFAGLAFAPDAASTVD